MKWGVAIYELVSEGKPPAMYLGPHRVLYLIHHLLLLFYISFFLSITPFFVNHWRMALEMKTTISNASFKGKPYKSRFDMGLKKNFQLYFGLITWTYPFPFFLPDGLPLGNGLHYEENPEFVDDDEEEAPR